MRPVEMLFNIIDKFAGMNEVDKAELRNDANLDYLKIRKELDELEGKPVTWKQKFVKWSEHWTVRTACAVVFIFLLPKIQEYFDGDSKEPEEDFGSFEVVE